MDRTPSKTIDLNQLQTCAMSGDLILFRGNMDDRFSRLVAFAQQPCPWTHVGVIIRDPTAKSVDESCFVFHSTVDKRTINVDKRADLKKTGPKFTPLSRAIADYGGECVAVRFFKCNERDNCEWQCKHNWRFCHAYNEFADLHLNKTYEDSRLEMLRAVTHSNEHADTSRFFCSELVAEFFNYLGLLPSNKFRPSNNYDVRDFSSLCRLPLLKTDIFPINGYDDECLIVE